MNRAIKTTPKVPPTIAPIIKLSIIPPHIFAILKDIAFVENGNIDFVVVFTASFNHRDDFSFRHRLNARGWDNRGKQGIEV